MFTIGLALQLRMRDLVCNTVCISICRISWCEKDELRCLETSTESLTWLVFPSSYPSKYMTLKADSYIACRAAKGLECVFPIWFTQCGCVWFTLAMPCPCHALTTPFFSRPRHSTAVERRPVGYLPAFGFFRLPCEVPRRLLSEAYQSSSQRSISTTVKSGSSTLQKRRSVKLLD